MRKTLATKLLAAAALLVGGLASTVSADILLFDDFNNGNLATGTTGTVGSVTPGFTATANALGTGSSTEPAGTSAVLNVTSNRSQGVASTAALDLSTIAGFTASFNIASAAVPGSNGIFLGFKDTSAGTFYRTADNFGIIIGGKYGAGNNDVYLIANDKDGAGGTGNGGAGLVQKLIATDITTASLASGFTATFTVRNDNSFSYSLTGAAFGSGVGGIGTLSGLTYATAFDSSDFVMASYQNGAAPGTGLQMAVNSITVTAIPEPSFLALSSLGLGGLVLRRRRNG